MSRRHSAEKREIIPDAKYGDVVLTKFMNSVMYEGKKSVAESIVYGALAIIKQKSGKDPIEVFSQALQNVKPVVEEKLQVDVDEAGGVLRPLEVAAHPVEAVGDAGEHQREKGRARAGEGAKLFTRSRKGPTCPCCRRRAGAMNGPRPPPRVCAGRSGPVCRCQHPWRYRKSCQKRGSSGNGSSPPRICMPPNSAQRCRLGMFLSGLSRPSASKASFRARNCASSGAENC